MKWNSLLSYYSSLGFLNWTVLLQKNNCISLLMGPGQPYPLAIKLQNQNAIVVTVHFPCFDAGYTRTRVYCGLAGGCSYEIEERAYFHLFSNKIQWHSFTLNYNLLNALSALCRPIGWVCPFWYLNIAFYFIHYFVSKCSVSIWAHTNSKAVSSTVHTA